MTEDFEQYINRKRADQCYGNNIEMQAVAEMYNRVIEVYEYSTGEGGGGGRGGGKVGVGLGGRRKGGRGGEVGVGQKGGKRRRRRRKEGEREMRERQQKDEITFFKLYSYKTTSLPLILSYQSSCSYEVQQLCGHDHFVQLLSKDLC